ncbi:poly polymerase catalytic domain-containing protein [Amylocystis lapponica]|nr:poly polymerase catalytic domain-containing protein [Amylocystis lapponica]
MPPRKKPASASVSTDAKPPSTRTRSRAKAPVPPSSSKGTSKVKGKGKRTRADSESENDEDGDAPDQKKVKVAAPDSASGSQNAPAPDKMITVMRRGRAVPVDPVSGLAFDHEALVTEEAVWDATLNQTDVGKNANKFYIIQLLHQIGNNASVTLFTRWGRVGENGQQQKKGPFSAAQSVQEFKKQFKAKAGVSWEERHGMVPKKGKYFFIERSFDDEDESKDDSGEGPGEGSSKKEEPEKIPESTLHAEVQALCRLIFSTKIMDAHLTAMNYNATKLPLGKLAKSTILSGFGALKTLAEVIENPDGDSAKALGGFRPAVEELTGRYYSVIPHVFGRNRPPIIDDLTTLKRELELVDALGDMEVASKLIASTVPKDDAGQPLNPLDAHFRSLSLSTMDPVVPDSKEFAALQAYARDTHGATHQHYQVHIQHAYRIERQEETDAWMQGGFDRAADGDRLLLWHGSRTTNFAGILKQGLRIAPPEAPVTGYMFGKGVYFADMMSKSANYCYAHLSGNTGLLLLCEVVAKPCHELYGAKFDADLSCKAANKLSTKGLGRTQPAEWQDAGEALDNDALKGCHMPKGPGKDVVDQMLYLQYNEYIVYNPAQIRVRYLLMVKLG